MGIRGGHLARADIVGMGRKGHDFGLGGDVPELDGRVVGAGEDMGGREGGEFGDMDGLLVGIKGAEDGARVDVKDLDEAGVVAGDEEFSVVAEVGAACDVLEPGYGLDDLLCAGGVDLDAGGGGDGVSVWFCGCKVDCGDGGVLLDEDGALELAPVARLGAVSGPVRTGRALHDHRLVVHRRTRVDAADTQWREDPGERGDPERR